MMVCVITYMGIGPAAGAKDPKFLFRIIIDIVTCYV